MAEYVRVASIWDLPPGKRLATWVSGVRVMLVNVEGSIYAADEQCTHAQCSLMTGALQGTIVECPCHRATFDLRDGKVLKAPATVDLPTYQVKLESGGIWVEQKPPEIV